jgi:hypothetical protein
VRDENSKVEFIAHNGIIEVRYFDSPKNQLCRSWRLPESIADELIAFWAMLKRDKEISFFYRKEQKCVITGRPSPGFTRG